MNKTPPLRLEFTLKEVFFIFTNNLKMNQRLLKILAVFLTLMMILSIRLYILQVYPSEIVQNSYQNYQEENISDMKYMILDTNGKDLMKYDKKYVLVIDTRPFKLNNYEETLEDLLALNFIMKSEVDNFNYSDIMKQSGKIYYTISEDTYNKINNLKNIKGIYTYMTDKSDTKKAWSVSSMLSKVLSDDERVPDSLDDSLYSYLKENDNPKCDFYVDGKAVYAKKEVKVNDNNKNIRLTIDKDIEDKVRSVLEKDEYSYLDNIGVTLIESDTGKIRAMVQKDESSANINLGIEQIGYEPGSVYKLITLGAALDMGLININDSFVCKGQICKQIHGKLTVEKALEQSCNDIFADIGAMVGYDKLMEYSQKQGLYSRVLNIAGNNKTEAEGIKPDKEAGISNISIGQCMNTTPLQMIGAVNTIVNNGIYKKPYIIESILDKDDNVVKDFSSEEKKIYSETASKLVKNAMKNVVKDGTGKNAFINGIEMGGKTGSSTGNEGKTHGWFAGYFTAQNKTYTMIVFTPDIKISGSNDEELGGGDTAAPIFKDIVLKINNK